MSSATTTAGFARLRDEDVLSSDGSLDYSTPVAELRQSFESGKSKNVQWRKEQLRQLQRLIEENHEAITAAVRADLGGAKFRGLVEFPSTHGFCAQALDELDSWAAPQRVSTPMQASVSCLGSSHVRQEPKGVALIMGPWNAPFECILHPLAAALSAGCCVVLKPSEISVNSSLVLTELVERYLDHACIRVVNGAVAETTALLKQHWDHIFYTGNGHVGRLVLEAASKHLTPVTLELGGKSSAIVDKSAKMDVVVSRIAAFKFLNAGQVCIAPDHVLIHKDREQEFLACMQKELETMFGAEPKNNESYGRIINARHVERISALLKGTQGQVVCGGLSDADAAANYFPPTLVRAAQLGEPLLSEEIFGPVLPVATFSHLDEAIQMSKGICSRPLALYVFSEDKAAIDQVLSNTLSGGVAINTCVEHAANSNLPFGGVGASGMGSYHGKAGFDEFTHRRAVLHQDSMLMRTSPLPPNPSDLIYDLATKAQVTGFLSESQRSVAKNVLTAGLCVAAGVVLRSKL